MKVRFTEQALKDLDEIATFLTAAYPAIAPAVEQRIRTVVARIARWPKSARRSSGRTGLTEHGVEILHIHHAAREPWDEDDET